MLQEAIFPATCNALFLACLTQCTTIRFSVLLVFRVHRFLAVVQNCKSLLTKESFWAILFRGQLWWLSAQKKTLRKQSCVTVRQKRYLLAFDHEKFRNMVIYSLMTLLFTFCLISIPFYIKIESWYVNDSRIVRNVWNLIIGENFSYLPVKLRRNKRLKTAKFLGRKSGKMGPHILCNILSFQTQITEIVLFSFSVQ